MVSLELMLVKFSTVYLDQKPIAWTNDVGSLSIAKGDHEVSAKFGSTFLDDRNLAPRMKVPFSETLDGTGLRVTLRRNVVTPAAKHRSE